MMNIEQTSPHSTSTMSGVASSDTMVNDDFVIVVAEEPVDLVNVPLLCTCCSQVIKGSHPLNYYTYATYYKKLFPNSKPGKVCINCYHACKKFMADTNNEFCSCCEGSIGTNPTHYEKYASIYAKLFAGSPFSSSPVPKVCQNCTKIARLYLNNENGQYCSCCRDCLGTTPSLYETHADIYKKLFPDSPHGNSPNVCDKCYRRAQQVKRESDGELCACCTKSLGRNPTLYVNYADYYKELYPESPIGSSKRVCQNCYGKAQQLKNDKEGKVCACCQRTAGRNPTSYDTQSHFYKQIFPESPHHAAKLVCTSCYQKAWRLKKKSPESKKSSTSSRKRGSPTRSMNSSSSETDQEEPIIALPPKQRKKNEIKSEAAKRKRMLSPVDIHFEPDRKRLKTES